LSDPGTDLFQQLLEGPPLEATAFPETSRYHGLGTLKLVNQDGSVIVYVKRRFIDPPERYSLLTVHLVRENERLDNIAAQYLGDPLQAWRICDANGVLRPAELTETVGGEIRITLPAGVSGSTNA
jgi:hypothetical protein